MRQAAELCWLTCAASPRNAEELTRAGGVTVLGMLLQRCLAIAPADAPPNLPAAALATAALRTLAAAAAFAPALLQFAER